MRFYTKPRLNRNSIPIVLSLIIVSLLLTVQKLSAQAKPEMSESSPEVILTIDGSGSMWGRVSGQPKYIILRSALIKALDKLKSPIKFGLVSYGHRYKRNCQDVELLMSTGSYDLKNFRKTLRGLSPRGRTPISSALERADKALGQKSRSGTIILLSDGYENCKRDPCAVAEKLKNARSGLNIHVLGLGLTPKDARSLSCLAERTGGSIKNTANQKELQIALTNLFASIGRPKIPEPEIVEQPPKPKPGLALKAVFAGTGSDIQEGVQWAVLDSDPTTTSDAKVLFRSEEPQPFFELKPGSYFVVAKFGLVTVGRSVSIRTDEPTVESIPINAGTLRIQTAAHKGGELLSDVSYRVYALEFDTGQTLKPIARTAGTSANFQLPVGTYRVIAEKDLARVERAVTIRSGELEDLSLIFNVGTLALSATDSEKGRPIKKVFYFVYETDPETLKAGREIIRTGAAQPSFDLPAGNYIVNVEHGYSRSQQRITVRPGEVTRKSIVLNSAELSLSSEIIGHSADVEDQLSYTIYSLGRSAATGGVEIARTSRPSATFQLKSGAYRIVSKLGYVNGQAETTAFLEAGKRVNVTILHQVGLISAELEQSNESPGLAAIFWTLRNSQGRELWRTSRPKPEFILKSGSYIISAESGGRLYETTFSVATGDKKVVMLNSE